MSEERPVGAHTAEAWAEGWPRPESRDAVSDATPAAAILSQHDPVERAMPLPASIVPAAARFCLPSAASTTAKGWLGTTSSLAAHIAVVTALLVYNPWRDYGFLGDYDEITIELVEAPPPELAASPQENAATPVAVEPQPSPEPAPVAIQPDTPAAAIPEISEEQSRQPASPEPRAAAESLAEQPPPAVAPQAPAAAALPEQPPPKPPASAAAEEPPVALPMERPEAPSAHPAARQPEQAAREKAEATARERATKAKRDEEAKAAAAARERSVLAKRAEDAKEAATQAQTRAEASAKAQASQAAAQAYRGAVVGHLAGFKRYPPGARARGTQGSPVVAFSLDGSGRVVSVTLARGSGDVEIDAEVVAMVRRASPFPAPPPGAPHAFSAPVNFRLQ
jgi:periplasmic protein TonB